MELAFFLFIFDQIIFLICSAFDDGGLFFGSSNLILQCFCLEKTGITKKRKRGGRVEWDLLKEYPHFLQWKGNKARKLILNFISCSFIHSSYCCHLFCRRRVLDLSPHL